MPTFDNTDLDSPQSESGMVHESVQYTDHDDVSVLKQGYGIQSPYNASNLAVYLPLQEDSSSVAYDFSGNGNDASYNNMGSSFDAADLGAEVTTVTGSDEHTFNPTINDSGQLATVNLTIDGSSRPHIAYDCDPQGDVIRLYYTDDHTTSWTEYSGNPILGPEASENRWPATIIDSSGTIHLFKWSYNTNTVTRWTSTDAINFTEQQTVTTAAGSNNPKVWVDPNTGDYVLVRHYNPSGEDDIAIRTSSTISGLASASDTIVLSWDTRGNAAPTLDYWDGYYWLYTESLTPYSVRAFGSSNLLGPYSEASDSPPLPKTNWNEAACPTLLYDGTGRWVYYSVSDDSSTNTWYSRHREVLSNTASGSVAVDTSTGPVGTTMAVFDGSSTYAHISNISTGIFSGGKGTLVFWCRVPDSSQTDTYSLQLRGDGANPGSFSILYGYESSKFEFFASGGSRTDIGTVTDTNLHQIAVSVDESAPETVAYLDGVEQNRVSSGDFASSDTDTGLYLGRSEAGNHCNIEMGNVMLYNSILTPTEVQELDDVVRGTGVHTTPKKVS